MADFMDEEAVVSSEEEDMSDDENRTKTKSPSSSKKRQSKMISSDEEEEDDDEEKAKEEMKGFIADDDEESRGGSRSGSDSGSESGADSRKKHRKKKRNKRRHDEEIDEIDEEDLALMEENLGIKIKKQRRRIRMDSDDDEPEETGTEDGSRRGRLEGNDDLPDIQGGEGVEDSGSDDVDDFIVDEEGRPMKKDRKKKHHIFSDSARQAAEDIFGVAFDYGEFEGYGEDEDEDAEEEDEYDSDMDADVDDEERQRKKDRKRSRKKKKPAKSIFELYEPKELELRHFTDLDNEIRNTDMPERMQLRSTPVTSVPEGAEEELDREADWIFRNGFTKIPISRQGESQIEADEWHVREAKGENIIEKIRKTLEFIRQSYNEVPFIAFYRKEYIRQSLTINDLWKVYEMDELWCKLEFRKRNLKALHENMMLYQGHKFCDKRDSKLPEGIRILTDEDLAKVDSINTFDELKDLDEHFKLYYSRDIEAMQEFVRKRRRETKGAAKGKRKAKKRITRMIKNEETGEQEEVTDEEGIEEHESEYGEEEDDQEQDTLKKTKASDPYNICARNKLSDMVSRFGISAEKFAENLKESYESVEIEDDPFDPLEAANDFTNERFTTPDEVLKASKFMFATQLARDPLVRKAVRRVFFEKATISVKATKRGFQEIDENHSCYPIKYLKDKPVTELKNEEWLRLTQAEEQKLITIEVADDIRVETHEGTTTYLKEATVFLTQKRASKCVMEWNAIRASCLQIAFMKMLYPMLRKELRYQLTIEAKNGILQRCKEKLYHWLKIAKYRVSFEDQDEDDWGTSHGCRVMAVMADGDRNNANYAVMVKSDGEIDKHQKFEHIHSKPPREIRSVRDMELKKALEKEWDVMKKFIIKNRPHVIAVGAKDRTAIYIRGEIIQMIGDLNADNDIQFPQIEVVLVDDNLAKVFASSERANQECREFPTLLKEAVSIARRLQDPLIEFSQLTGPENEITSLKYHPMQDRLSEEELVRGLTIEFINRTNEVGVDINECVARPYMSNLVQFISGLGPRKAAALLKTLGQMQSGQRLENRQQLVTLCHMGPKVLINCAGFIKIDTSSLGDSDTYVEILDGSRIHNEAYEWARQIAMDALEYDEDEHNPAAALEEIMNEPEKLEELDLDAFAKQLESIGFGKKSTTLHDIRSELQCMYKDLRQPYKQPGEAEFFNLICKETPETLWPGKLCPAIVKKFQYKRPAQEEFDNAAPKRVEGTDKWQCPFCFQDEFDELHLVWSHFDAEEGNNRCPGVCKGIDVVLDNDMIAYITLGLMSDSEVIRPEDRVQPGQSIYCRIIEIDAERLSLRASCKTSILEDSKEEWKPKLDECFDKDARDRDLEQYTTEKQQQQRQAYTKRVIVHPSFYNIGYNEAETLMKNMDKGDTIIRPSSKGADRLTCTWKVHDDIHQHIDVQEQEKINSFSLGNSLWIGNEEFEDLDEIIARHINPMAAHVRDILNFKYYKYTNGGKRDKAEEILHNERNMQPSKIHYIVSVSKDLPGKFLLSYLANPKVTRHEYFTVTPDGLRFRQRSFETLEILIKWFKNHCRDPIPGTPNAAGRRSSRTPFMSSSNTPRQGRMTPLQCGAGIDAPFKTPKYGDFTTPYTPSGRTPAMSPYYDPATR